jgi:hypothetical protein
MLKLPQSTRNNTIGNIMYRITYLTGRITAVRDYDRYDVEIAGSGKSWQRMFVNDPNIAYKVGDTVGIGWEDGNREKPVIIGILRDITEIEVSSSVNSLGI